MKTMSRGDFIEAENRINPDEATRSRQQRQLFLQISFGRYESNARNIAQLSNHWWMPNSVSKGFGPAMRPAPVMRHRVWRTRPPTRFILIHSKRILIWGLHLSWWGIGIILIRARSYGRVQTFAGWIWIDSYGYILGRPDLDLFWGTLFFGFIGS